jgi:predicted MFS family arabinose efflux permease
MGSSAGAPLGGLFADTIGWRWAFLIQVPATVVAIITTSLALDLPRAQDSNFRTNIKRVDFLGAITLMLAIFCLLLGLDRGGNISWSDNLTVSSLITFILLSILFATIEMKFASEPFAPKYIIVNRSLIASYLVNFFSFGAAVTSVYQVSLYLQAVLGKTASQAGVYLLPYFAGGVSGSLAGGLLMQATGKYYWLTFAACVSMVVGTTLLTLFSGVLATAVIGITIGIVFSSIGNGSATTTSLVSLIANAGPKNQAIAPAVSYLFRSLGSVVSLSLGSFLMQNTLRTYLRLGLSGDDLDEIVRRVRESLSYIDELDPTTQAIVRVAYEKAAHVTLYFTVGLSVCAVISSVFIKETSLEAER